MGGYRMALFGDVTSNEEMPDPDREWGFETADGWFINPRKHMKGAQLQFCQCPGPNEKVTVTFASPHLMMENMPKMTRLPRDSSRSAGWTGATCTPISFQPF